MKKALKITGKILLCILILLIAFLLILFVYHRIMLNKEDKLLENYPGELIEIDGHRMNIYSEGEGEHTLVFLAPAGDTSPAMTFKPLYPATIFALFSIENIAIVCYNITIIRLYNDYP